MVWLRNATLSVDVFFALSGFLSFMSWANLYSNIKQNRLIQLIILYVNRYLRIVPLMFVAIVFSLYFITFLIDGPVAF